MTRYYAKIRLEVFFVVIIYDHINNFSILQAEINNLILLRLFE